jgi:hypothetical protein
MISWVDEEVPALESPLTAISHPSLVPLPPACATLFGQAPDCEIAVSEEMTGDACPLCASRPGYENTFSTGHSFYYLIEIASRHKMV